MDSFVWYRGYDAVYQKRYGEFISSVNEGKYEYWSGQWYNFPNRVNSLSWLCRC